MATGFQINAFQNDAFQVAEDQNLVVSSPTTTSVLRSSTKTFLASCATAASKVLTFGTTIVATALSTHVVMPLQFRRTISILVGGVVTIIRDATHTVVVFFSPTVTSLTRRTAKSIAVSSAATVVLLRSAQRVIAVALTTAASVRKAAAKVFLISSPSAVLLVRGAAIVRAIVLTTTALATAIKAFPQTVAVLASTSATLLRSAGKVVAASCSGTVAGVVANLVRFVTDIVTTITGPTVDATTNIFIYRNVIRFEAEFFGSDDTPVVPGSVNLVLTVAALAHLSTGLITVPMVYSGGATWVAMWETTDIPQGVVYWAIRATGPHAADEGVFFLEANLANE